MLKSHTYNAKLSDIGCQKMVLLVIKVKCLQESRAPAESCIYKSPAVCSTISIFKEMRVDYVVAVCSAISNFKEMRVDYVICWSVGN
ncbi:hypothetical protein C5167_026117 [Papaver somniferum]|nr:hypothetical protein C5167_026117 [Papaver somniferum]